MCRERLQAPRSVRFRKHGAPVDEGYTHAHLRGREKGRSSPEPEHTNSSPVRESLHPCLSPLKAVGVWLCVVHECWRGPSG